MEQSQSADRAFLSRPIKIRQGARVLARAKDLQGTLGIRIWFFVLISAMVINLYLSFHTVLPLWIHAILSLLFSHWMLTPLHEACHGNYGKSSRGYRWINEMMGSLAAFSIMSYLPLFRKIHLTHHKFVNDPQRDPDAFFKGTFLQVLPRSCMVYPYYVGKYFLLLWEKRDLKQISGFALYFASFAIFAYWMAAVLSPEIIYGVWLGPAVVAFTLDALVLDWVAHYPHSKQDADSGSLYRPKNRFWSLILQGQNYHRLHHLYPWIPASQYAQAHQTLIANHIDLALPEDHQITGGRLL